MTIELTEQMKQESLALARGIVNAMLDVHTLSGIAALISVTGSVCFNEANGDVDKALRRAEQIHHGARDVIMKLHIAEEGNGDAT